MLIYLLNADLLFADCAKTDDKGVWPLSRAPGMPGMTSLTGCNRDQLSLPPSHLMESLGATTNTPQKNSYMVPNQTPVC